ncbi:MAG: biopolymer transporter ExbD [Bacteroidaceae bacterium]|jgi:biopolymer transport protein ExbD|nr:biopolymer transporter ExbD [Bacteroidaceae bacterium]
MSKFSDKGKAEMPELNTSSLPDLIFSILFFFMIVTSMREQEVKVQVELPSGTELTKLERKSAITNIYIGTPMNNKESQEAGIQLNDRQLSRREVNNLKSYIVEEKERLGNKAAKMKVALKIDNNIDMGLLSDVKMQLRKAYALQIVYSANEAKSSTGN